VPERTFTAADADCRVYTFKEGVLAAVAHDLMLRVERFSVVVDEERGCVNASLDAASLRVVTAMKHGREAPELLASHNFEKIEENLRNDVLEVRRFPKVEFRSSALTPEGEGYRVEGELQLHGRTRSLRCMALREGDVWRAEVELHQPDFGIRPFTAMLGALRVKPLVTIVISVPV